MWIRKMTVTHCVSIEYLFQWLLLTHWIKGVRARQLLGFFSDGYSEVSEHTPAPTAY